MAKQGSRILLIAVLLALIGVGFSTGGQPCPKGGCPPPPHEQPPPGFISILVIVNVAGVPECDIAKKPIAGANVTLTSQAAKVFKDRVLAEGVTDEEGKYAAWIIIFAKDLQEAVNNLLITVEKEGFQLQSVVSIVATIPFVGSFILSSACLQESVSPIISVDPQRIIFWEASTDSASTQNLYIFNNGDAPVSIKTVTTNAPFSAQVGEDLISPHDFVRAEITFTPPGIGEFTGVITFETDQPSAPQIKIPVEARAVAIGQANLSVDTVRLSIIPEVHRLFDDTMEEFNFTIMLSPLGPGRIQGDLNLSVSGDLPNGTLVSLSPDRLPLGQLELAHLALKVPRDAQLREYSFQVVGQTGALTVLSPLTTILLMDGPNPTACSCPEDAPGPSSNVLDSKTVNFPDPAPPATPSGNPVATVNVKVEGPKVGECCINGKFRMTLTVSNEIPGGRNGLTAFFLLRGYCAQGGASLTATTKGTGHAITGEFKPAAGGAFAAIDCTKLPAGVPNDNIENAKYIFRFSTSYEVPIECKGLFSEHQWDWLCGVAETKYVTRFELGGNEKGAIEVHWTVEVHGNRCVIGVVNTSVDKILFLRNNTVYDPKNDEYLDKDADSDRPSGDGIKNYDEILKGTDPRDPNSKP